MATDNRLPPHDLESEQVLLGSLIRDAGVRNEAMALVAREDFYTDANQKLFTSIVSLHTASLPVDLVTIAQDLKRREQIDDVRYDHLADTFDAAPTAFGWDHHLRVVKGMSLRRRLIVELNQLLARCWQPTGDDDELLCDLQRLAFHAADERRVVETHHIREVFKQAMHDIDNRARNGISGVASGLDDLDRLTGGFHPGELCFLAARPSVGKTALGIQIALAAAGAGTPTLVFSLEQARGELATRILAGGAQINSHCLRTGRLSRDDAQRVGAVVESMRDLPLWINDSPTHRLLSIGSVTRGLRAQQGIGLVVIDYLQLLEPDDKRAKPHEQTQALSRGLKVLAREMSIPILCLAQLNRNIEHRGESRPRLSDLREAGEQDADTVIALWRPAERDDDPVEQIDAAVLKQRNGPTGDVSLGYVKAQLRFVNYADEKAFNL